MGRPGAAKRLKKAEKAKVKLKGHTTKFLPKGKNITNTTFKVRKIVLPSQLTAPDDSQPLSRRKLSIKEVFTRLQHYSSSQRLEGLTGLRELLSQLDAEQLATHLSGMVDHLARLALDPERDVRRSSAQLLTSLLTHVDEVQLSPFSAILGSYLSCAMTHIQPGVQEDSLLLLDALLEYSPSLVAASAHRLLPCTLDMISRLRNETQPNRQLSINLSSNLTSIAWRARIFGRLQALLHVSLEHRKKVYCVNDDAEGKTEENKKHRNLTRNVGVIYSTGCHYPIYKTHYAVPVSLTKIFHGRSTQTASQELLGDEAQLRNYVESLMPLLFDSWVEVSPHTSKDAKRRSDGTGLNLDAAIILHCILEIMRLLWEHICLWEKSNASHELTEWFRKMYANDINRFLAVGFPYGPNHEVDSESEEEESQGRGRKRSKTQQKSGDAAVLIQLASPQLFHDKNEQKQIGGHAVTHCIVQNLGLCHILASIVKSPSTPLAEKILVFLTNCLKQWESAYSPWIDHMLCAINSVVEHSRAWPGSISVDPLLAAVVQRYNQSVLKKSGLHKEIVEKLGGLLGSIAMGPNSQYFLKSNFMQEWIYQLPASLCFETVTQSRLQMINHLACHKNESLLRGLQAAFPQLLCKLHTVLKSGENVFEVEAGLASLLFWVPEWNNDLVSAVGEHLVSGHFSPSFTNKVTEILAIRKENSPALKEASWWSQLSIST